MGLSPTLDPTGDLQAGRATLKAHEAGGWALPGGTVTFDRQEADRVASRMGRLIGSRDFGHSTEKQRRA